MNAITAALTAVGGYVPDFVLSNKVLETMVDTNDEWIEIKEFFGNSCVRCGSKDYIVKDGDLMEFLFNV